jgi:hypothetical protein
MEESVKLIETPDIIKVEQKIDFDYIVTKNPITILPILITWKNFLYNFFKSLLVLTYRTIYSILHIVVDLSINLITFLGPVLNSVYGKINEQELYRIIALSASVGGGLAGSLKYIADNAKNYISDPTILLFVQTLVTTVSNNLVLTGIVLAVFLIDFYRRKYQHGDSA